MIRLTTPNDGLAHYVAPDNIARISEAGASSQWHGICSIVRLTDGGVLECREDAHSISKSVETHNAVKAKTKELIDAKA